MSFERFQEVFSMFRTVVIAAVLGLPFSSFAIPGHITKPSAEPNWSTNVDDPGTTTLRMHEQTGVVEIYDEVQHTWVTAEAIDAGDARLAGAIAEEDIKPVIHQAQYYGGYGNPCVQAYNPCANPCVQTYVNPCAVPTPYYQIPAAPYAAYAPPVVAAPYGGYNRYTDGNPYNDYGRPYAAPYARGYARGYIRGHRPYYARPYAGHRVGPHVVYRYPRAVRRW